MDELEQIDCDHDGVALAGRIARPAGDGPHPVVLVMHSALGIRHMVQDKARELARLGYVAIATDMYGAGAAIDSPDAAGRHYMELGADPERLRARTVRWFETAAALPGLDPARIAAIGYCFGGQCVLELARSGVNLRAAISFHGILKTHAPALAGSVRGHVVAWCGADDPYAPPSDITALRDEMAAAGVRYSVCEFGGVAHAFTDRDAASLGMPGIAHDAAADAVSWAGALALLREVLT